MAGRPTPRRGQRTALLVLGMHRSGTSALAGAIHFWGATTPRSLMAPDATNPRGFWESDAIVRIHEELLASMQSSWDDWRSVSRHWFTSAEASAFETRLADTVACEFGDASLLVLKDPRICRLLPLWIRILGRLEIRPVAINITRHPLEVARSLATRNDFSLQRSLLLWLRHVLDAESDSRSLARCFITYETLLNDPAAIMHRVGRIAGIQWPRETADALADTRQFLTSELRHSVFDQNHLNQHAGVVSWVTRASSVLAELASRPEAAAGLTALDDIKKAFDTACGAFDEIAATTLTAATRTTELTGLLEQRDAALDESHQRLAEEQEARHVIEVDRDGWQRLAIERERAVQTHAAIVAETNASKGRLEDDRNNWRELALERQVELDRHKAALEELQLNRQPLETDRDNWRRLADDRQTALERGGTALEALRAAQSSLEADRDNWRQLAGDRQTELERHTAALDALRATQSSLEADRDNWRQLAGDRQTELERHRAALDTHRAAQSSLQTDRDNWRDLAHERQRALDLHAAKLDELRMACESAEADRARWQQRADEIDHTLRQVQVAAENERRDRAAEVERLSRQVEDATAARDSERAANGTLERVVAELWRRADQSRRRSFELETALARLTEDVEQRAQHADGELTRLRKELDTIFASRTWRWGEPVGRFIQSLGFMTGK